MISGGIISKYLPVEAQVSLLSELVQAHRFDEVVGLLDATQLTADSLEEIGRQILELLENELAVLSGGEMAFAGLDEELCLLSQLIGKIGSLEKLFQSWISGVLVAYVQEFSTKLFPDGASRDLLFGFLGNKSSAETSGNFDIIVLLRFLGSVCLYSDSVASICVPELEMVLIALLGCSDETIASMSSNLMRWRVRVIAERCSMDEQFDSICWLVVQQTLMGGPGGSWKQTNGLSFLLRFLTVSEFTPGLQTFVRKEEYWTNLQAALNDDVQEYRKIGLSVLKMTIKKIPEDMGAFSAQTFSWDPSKKISLINSWRGFTTLYEIVSLDTALNQIEAASEDILNLFQDSNLHSRWGLLLFSTGFRASMESVRKYMIALLLRVRVKSVIAKDLVNLRNIFLPSLMEAHFFTTDGKSCRYGEKLAQFVAEVLWESGSNAPLVIKAMLDTLVDQGASFDPARVYLSLGILDFLEKQEQKPLTSTHLQMITKLYEVENEDAVFETTIQTIYLKYALHISPSVSPREWIKFLVSHIKRKQGNYAFISPLLSSFKTFASNHFTLEVIKSDIDSLIGMDETTDLLALLLFDYKEVSVTRELLIETARSKQVVPKFTEKVLDHVLSLIMTPDTDSLSYESSAVLVGYPELDFKPLMTIELRPLFDSLMQDVTLEKLEFFVAVYKRFVYSNNELFKLSWSLLVDLYHSIESQIRDSKVANYKIKDETYGSFFELLHFFLVHSATQPSVEVAELIDLLHRNINRDNGNSIGNKGVAKLSAFILTNCFQQKVSEESWSHLLRIFDMLTTIWDYISCERLVLKQKDLHLATINGLFHPTILLYASSSSSNGRSLSKRVHSYGKRIIQQAYSRRSMLPLISKNILLLMREHGDKLENTDQDPWWIIDTMIDIFTCEQTSVNMFRLKTVIADLFDNRLSTSSSLSRIYEDIYGVEEVSAKIWIIDSLLIAPQRFKDSFIMKAFHSTNLLTAKKKTDGAEEIQRLLGWQLTLLCFRDSDKKQLISTIPKLILKNLLDEVSPVIRIYMEWFIALLLSHSTAEREFEDLTSELFSLMDDHSRPIVVVSAERIIFLILKAQISNKSKQFDSLLIRFISVLVPNATSSKPLVRHFSNSLMLMFWPAFQEHIRDTTFRLTMEGLYNKAVATKLSGKYRAGDATAWDIYADLTLIGIFGGVLKKTLDHDLPYISKSTFIKFSSSHVSFPLGEEDTSSWLPKRITRGSEIGVQQSGPNSLSQLQTKSGAWETLMMLDNEDQNKAVNRSDLIVVSSLVDKPPNLGGICRLCDVLGVGLLTVQDIRVKNHPQFKNVAVTADRWMPMVEVPLQSISDFMLEKKREGYTLIGLEQTDKSVKLDTQYKFPRKSLILLGTEAHGIPGELLNQLDLCLEIQQFGVIRSMNIQTATAVIVHSYTIQHM